VAALREVGIASPEDRLESYPHELSGGMRQRVLLAMALLCEPDLLIADEPTTALDVTVQAQILHMVAERKRERGLSVLWITHDLGVVARLGDRVAVAYAGRVVERGTVDDVLGRPRHPYTQALRRSVPRLDQRAEHPLYSLRGAPRGQGRRLAAVLFAPAATTLWSAAPRSFRPSVPRPAQATGYAATSTWRTHERALALSIGRERALCRARRALGAPPGCGTRRG